MTGAVHVAVVGAGEAVGAVLAQAEAVGAGLAAGGAVVVCGGLGGVMAAACRGAKAAGGTTLGILPGTERSEANPWVDIAVPTGMGEARNALVVRSADAVVAVAGEYGTLSEIALALKLGRPVIGLASWDIDGVQRAADAGDAVARALASAAPPDRHGRRP
ncbi:MAG: TIGR00725 family protein [Actinomycetota bacterium]|nr:TIGR00725 family protein [Actinomycetota bacterium]